MRDRFDFPGRAELEELRDAGSSPSMMLPRGLWDAVGNRSITGSEFAARARQIGFQQARLIAEVWDVDLAELAKRAVLDVIRGDDEDPHRPVLQVTDHELERDSFFETIREALEPIADDVARKIVVLEQITTQPEHRETRREMYEGLHRIPTSGSTAVDSLGMLPGYTRRKTDEG